MKTKSVNWIKYTFLILSIFISSNIFISCSSSPAANPEESPDESLDGPYAKAEGMSLDLQWVSQGKKQTKFIKNPSLPYHFDEDGLHANIHTLNFLESKILSFKGDFPVAALSDPHGKYDLMIDLMSKNGIIDKEGHWNFKNGHLVITGDIFDRGDKVTEILWFVYRLEKEAKKAGGKVHLLLGNHEVLVMNGALGYLHKKYKHTAKILDIPFEQLFSNKTVLGNWLRSKPVLLRINNMLFTHGGFHPELAEQEKTLEDINQNFKKSLIHNNSTRHRSEWEKYLHGAKGPVWYRGYFKDNGATSAEIDLLLKHFDVEHIVVGHTSQREILTRHKGKVIAIDSSIKGGKYGEILFVNGKKITRGTPSGKRLPLK